jgi:hypothetical protein
MSIILAALAATTLPPPLCNQLATNRNPATLEYLRRVDAPSDKKLEVINSGYARIIADYTSCVFQDHQYDRKYDAERRDIFRRFFMHKEVNKVLTTKVSIRPLGVSGSATLISMGRDSGKQGETWSTDVGNSLTILPYFRVEPNTTLQLTASYNSERTYSSSVASDTIDIIDRATKLITPTTPLITASNKSRFNDASTFVDNAINGLLKVDIKENLRTDSPIGKDGIVLAQLVLYATGANDPYERNRSEYARPIGMWTIKAVPFEGSSLFNGVASAATPSIASVLNFQVTDGKRVREMLAGDTIVAGARDTVLKPGTGSKKEAVAGLCRAVASRADAEGFSSSDVNWIVAAYIADMTPAANPATDVQSGCPSKSLKDIYTQEKIDSTAG